MLLDKYGDAYEDKSANWRVGIDGIVPLNGGYARRLLSDRTEKAPSGSEIVVRDSGGGERTEKSDIFPTVTMMPSYENGKASYVISLYGGDASQLDADLVNVSGQKIKVEKTGNGHTIVFAIPLERANQRWRLTGTLRKTPVATGAQPLYVDPAFDFSPEMTADWTVSGDFRAPFVHPTRMDFGLDPSRYMLGTCEDGSNGYDDSYRGVISSPTFLITKPSIHMLVGGGAGDGVYVELIDASTGEQLAVARGRNSETLSPVVWDVSKYAGKTVRIRVEDREVGGWGHINIADIRCE
jgi:hypothetical protein